MKKIPQIKLASCDGCGVCAMRCSKEALAIRKITDEENAGLSFIGRLATKLKGRKKSFLVFPEKCSGCGKCVKLCHERAIRMK